MSSAPATTPTTALGEGHETADEDDREDEEQRGDDRGASGEARADPLDHSERGEERDTVQSAPAQRAAEELVHCPRVVADPVGAAQRFTRRIEGGAPEREVERQPGRCAQPRQKVAEAAAWIEEKKEREAERARAEGRERPDHERVAPGAVQCASPIASARIAASSAAVAP